MNLNNIILIGRSLKEYQLMFNLTEEELKNNSILSIADGIASFNAQASKKYNSQITSIDIIYNFSALKIKNRFDEVIDNVIFQIENSLDNWLWDYHKSPAKLKKHRIEIMNLFINDFIKNKDKYIFGELPKLPPFNQSFDLALSSHFLFLYSNILNYKFHLNSILEVLKITNEFRIFPLIDLNFQKSLHLDAIIGALKNIGYSIEIVKVNYEFQKNANEMLIIKKK